MSQTLTEPIRIEHLTKSYRRGGETVTALDDITLDLHPGQLNAIVGPSGSGKTTLLNLLVDGDAPDRGTITGRPPLEGWNALALVPQAIGLLDELTVTENVGFPGRVGAEVHRSPDELMAELGVDHLGDRTPSEISLGEQQRTAVVRALTTTPQLLVADEPTSHQDEANTLRIVSALQRGAEAGSLVVIATHDARVIEHCHTVTHLRDGRVISPT